MSDDLPARLRSCITESGGIDLHGPAGAALLREAADEIERLRGALDAAAEEFAETMHASIQARKVRP